MTTTIRDARVKRGISQKELARTAGIDARTLRKIENGEHVSDLSQKAVEQVLGVSNQLSSSASTKASRFGLGYHLKFTATVLLFVVLFGTLCRIASPDAEGFWYLFPGMTSLILVFSACFYWVHATTPVLGNTIVEIKSDLAKATAFGDPLTMTKGWLGRSDVTIKKIVSDKSGVSFTVYADFDVREYPALVEKLRGFGLDASVSTAF